MSTPSIDERFNEVLQDVRRRIGTDRVADILDGILIGAAKTKGNIEKSVDALLVYTSLTSRSEHAALAKSVAALGRKLDMLTRRVEKLAEGTVGASKTARTSTRKRTGSRGPTGAKSRAGARKAAGSKAKAPAAKPKPAGARAKAKKKTSTRARR
jgi:hypothetical protein